MALASNRVGVILSARNQQGKILLASTHGIDIKKASQAAHEACAQLMQLSAADEGDIAPTTQGLPLGCGSVRLWHGRWRVFYRALGPTLAMVVAPGHQNAFSSLNLLGQVVRLLTSDGKIPEVPVERVQRKYAEVYLAVDAMVSTYGVLTANEALEDARAMMDSLSSSTGQVATKRLARHPIPPVSYKVDRRTLKAQVGQLSQMKFSTADAMAGMRSLPGFELEERQVQKAERAAMLDDADPFADMATANKDKDKAAEEDPFAPVGDVEIKTEEAAKAAASTAPSRPLLRLTETWHAEFEGGKMLRAGLDGNVHWVEDADKDPVAPVRFSMSCAVWADNQVADCLKGAQRHSMATSIVREMSGGILADGASSRVTPPVTLLRYYVPQGPAMPPPVLVNLGASTQPTRDGHTAVLVGLRAAVAQQSHITYDSMTVSISLPALYRQPIRVSPPGALYCPERRLLHWTLPGSSLTPGTLEVMAAVFRVRGSEAECAQAALDGLVASVDMLGHPGKQGYSGAALNQSFEQATTREEKTARFKAHAVARPAPSLL